MSDSRKKLKTLSRKSIRLRGYDYRQAGAYFITICTKKMKNMFGRIVNGEMKLNNIGIIALDELNKLPKTFPQLIIYDDEFIIMPNHIHVIFWIIEVGATEPVARTTNKGIAPGSLGTIIGQFKSRATKSINKLNRTPGEQVWQRNYFDRIIRNNKELLAIKKYITDNPLQWEEDREHKYPLIE